ncbi:MAG: hypothetical protein NWE89_14830, partial [Candidatus Bathyarchaeota archaeon]|nr:hypothetical protein [Candidatus Bathyarchaeota archaeon]
MHGSVYSGDRKLRTAEVWLLINDRYVKCIPQTSWHSRFWFHVRLGAGTYALKVEGYKIMAEFTHKTGERREIRIKKEYKVTSPPMGVISAPRIINPKRLLPFTYEVENWRRITLSEAIELSCKAAEIIVREYPDTSTVRLVGGTVQRGWTRRDIDLLVDSRELLREGGPAVPGWPSAVKSIRLEGEIEKAIA